MYDERLVPRNCCRRFLTNASPPEDILNVVKLLEDEFIPHQTRVRGCCPRTIMEHYALS